MKIEVIGGEDFNNEESKEETSDKNATKEAIVKKPHEIYNYGFNRNFLKFFENLEVYTLTIENLKG